MRFRKKAPLTLALISLLLPVSPLMAQSTLPVASDFSLPAPTLVTLHLKDASAQEAFDALAEQAQIEILDPQKILQKNNLPRITIDLDDQPFFIALRQLCVQFNVWPTQTRQNNIAIAVANNQDDDFEGEPMLSGMAGPSVASGPFLFIIDQLVRTNTVDPSLEQDITGVLEIHCIILTDPKARPLVKPFGLTLDELIDAQGNPLPLPGRHPYGGDFFDRSDLIQNMSAHLHYPSDQGDSISRLKIIVRALMATKTQTLEIPDILSALGTEKSVAGIHCRIGDVEASDGRYRVQITMTCEDQTPEALGQLKEILSSGIGIKLVDKAGRPIPFRSVDTIRQVQEEDKKSLSATLDFRQNQFTTANPPGEPARLLWDIPVEIKEISIPFEFNNLPVPR